MEEEKEESLIDEEGHPEAEKKTVNSSEPPKPARQPIPMTITDIELEQLKKEAAESKDKYLRLLAEQENTRKRMQKEREQLIQYAMQNLVADFLNPIDHLDNALKFTEQMSDEIRHWGEGFRMILGQFKEVLNHIGVVPIVSVGKSFDPHFHEAIETVETNDYPPGTVIEESIKGYKMGDRVIRPARVKVSKAPTSKAEEKKINSDK